MGLFDKKYCDICGNKISLLGNKKLADGNMCGECEKKLSTWFSDRKANTVEQIKAQLAYREENAKLLAGFHPTREIGTEDDKFLLIDENMGRFVLLRGGENMNKNPDLLELSKVRDVRMEIKESRSEVRRKDADGNSRSFDPKHYSYKYNFKMTIDYDGEFFDTLQFDINGASINGGEDGDDYNGMTQGSSFMENAANQFFGELGIKNDPAVQSRISRTGSFGMRNDLPGGYRPDGYTSMKETDIQRYRDCEAAGMEIVSALLGRSGGTAPAGQSAAPDILSMDQTSLNRKALELISGGREEEAEPYLLRLIEIGDDTVRPLYTMSLLKRADKAATEDEAIEIYKKLVVYDPIEYTGLLLKMQQKLMAGSSEAGARDMLEWAEKAKAAGQDAENFIRFANMSLTASMSGLRDGASHEEQMAAALMAAQAAAMETTRANAAAQTQAPNGDNGWVCSCGAQNTGRFCGECGASRP